MRGKEDERNLIRKRRMLTDAKERNEIDERKEGKIEECLTLNSWKRRSIAWKRRREINKKEEEDGDGCSGEKLNG